MDLFQVNDDIRRMSGKEMMAYFGDDGEPMSSPKPQTSQPSSRFDVGGFRAQDFEEVFGLSSVPENEAYSEGSTTGTKQVGALGTYLTQDDFERNRNSDKTWEYYAKVYGEDAAREKREGNPDGLSINALDALYDRLSGPAPEMKEEEEEPYFPIKTPEVAKAAARTKSFSKNVRPNYGTLLFGDDESSSGVLDKFKKDSNKFFKRDPIFDYESYKTEQDMLRDERQGERALNRRDNGKPFNITNLPKGIDRFAEFKSQFNK